MEREGGVGWAKQARAAGEPMVDPAHQDAALDPGLLTADEHEALRLTGELGSLVARIIGVGTDQAHHDWVEFTIRLHGVQHMILRQAAARAYPDLYRQLGTTIPLQTQPSRR